MNAIPSLQVSLIRLISIVAVTVLHFCQMWSFPEESGMLATFNAVCRGTMFWAVPVFIVISGYCLAEPRADLGGYFRKRIARIATPILVWTIFYMALQLSSVSGLRPRQLGKAFLYADIYYHLWFIYMIPGLYLVAPLLWKCRARFSRSGSIILAALLFLAVWILPEFWNEGILRTILLRFVPYIALFFSGMLLRELPEKRGLLFLFTGLSLFYLAGAALNPLGFNRSWYYLYSGPAAALGGIALSGLLLRIPMRGDNRAIVRGGELAFGVYLLHPFIIVVLRTAGLFRSPNGMRYALALTLTLTLSFTGAWIISRIPYLRRCI